MLKRKLIADETVADILQFVKGGDDVDDCDTADDLNKIYDDGDINVAQEESDDDNSSDSDDGDPEDYNQRPPQKILTPMTLLLLRSTEWNGFDWFSVSKEKNKNQENLLDE